MDCPTVELFYDDAWRDITQWVNTDDAISIGRGRQDEQSQPSPSKCTLKLDNRDGRFSPRNPLSPLYGLIGRNTPIRVRLGANDVSLELPGAEGSSASTPDDPSLDITGDIDIRMDCEPVSWRPAEALMLMRKYLTTGDQRSWQLWLTPSGQLVLRWSPDGTFGSSITIGSTVTVPSSTTRLAAAVLLDVDDGAAGNTVTFFTAPTLGGTYMQFGDVVTTPGTTSIFASTTTLRIGDGVTTPGDIHPFHGRVYGAEVRNGLAGPAVANPDFTALAPGTTEFSDAAGRPWSLHGDARIADASIRFTGEVSSWPQRWTSELDVWTPVEASGLRRRLGQGAPTLRSAMYRGTTGGNITPPVAYWPCEDGQDATTLASAFDGHPPIGIVPDVDLAAFSDAPASGPIPTITTGTLNGRVPDYPASDFLRFMVFASIPTAITGEPTIWEFGTTGSARRWRLSIDSTGELRLRAYNAEGDQILSWTFIGSAILGQRGLLWVWLRQVGADVAFEFGWMREGDVTASWANSTLAGHTQGNIRVFGIGKYSGDLNGMAIGHVTVLDTTEFWAIAPFARAWSGETAAERITRLCAEEDVPLRTTGPADESQLVGPQRIGTFLDLIEAAATADQGIIVDDRDALRLLYRTGQTLYNQTAALALDYTAGHLAPPLEPVEDDQATRNDITVQRPEGSSARAVLETGALSIQAPPDGVGRYDDTRTVIVHADGQLRHQAGWLLHLGTVDEPRYPSVTVLLHNPDLAAKVDGILATDAGDRIQIINPPLWLPPDLIDLIGQGYTEIHNGLEHSITFNCTPASPWTVAVADDAELGRADTEDSRLAADATAAATTLRVRTFRGPMWTETPAEFPFDAELGGEVVQVTAIADQAVAEDFEDATLDITVTGTWARSTDAAHAGSWSFKSATISHTETTDAVVTVPADAATLQFWYRASSEAVFDFFRFLIDGALQFEASGESGWVRSAVYDVSAATEVTFRYIKDGSTSSGEDAAYVDDIVFDQQVQEFTVVRAQNGISKAQTTGTDVRLATPAIAAL